MPIFKTKTAPAPPPPPVEPPPPATLDDIADHLRRLESRVDGIGGAVLTVRNEVAYTKRRVPGVLSIATGVLLGQILFWILGVVFVALFWTVILEAVGGAATAAGGSSRTPSR